MMTGADVDVAATTGVDAGAELAALVEATAGTDDAALGAARAGVEAAAGLEVLVDAVAVMSVFEMMNRLANATGTPLDESLLGATTSVRGELDLDRFESSADSPLTS